MMKQKNDSEKDMVTFSFSLVEIIGAMPKNEGAIHDPQIGEELIAEMIAIKPVPYKNGFLRIEAHIAESVARILPRFIASP